MRFTIVFLLAILILSACSNWKEEPAISKVMFINALPGVNQATLLFDGQPLNAAPLAYGIYTTAYRDIRAGRRIVSVDLSGNIEPEEIGTFYIPEFNSFTAYITIDTAMNSNQASFYLYQDALTKPADGKANVRFMNLYPDKTANLDLLISGRTEAFATNQKFGNITAFVSTDTSSFYEFRLRQKNVIIPNVIWKLPVNRQNSYTILVTDTLLTTTGERRPNLKLITHQ